MITTVVTSITSTVTSVTAITGFGMLPSLVAAIALVVFLCVKELATANENSSHQSLAKFLDVGIVPLIIAFTMIVIVTIVGIIA